MRRPHAPQFIRDVVGVSADLVTIALVIVLAAPAVIGYASNSLVAALVAALAMALLVILGCIYRIRQLARQGAYLRHSRLDAHIRSRYAGAMMRGLYREVSARVGVANEVREIAESALNGEPEPDLAVAEVIEHPSSTWLPDPSDPASLTMSTSDFEACVERAKLIAGGKSDRLVSATFDSIVITVGMPFNSAREVISANFWVEDRSVGTNTHVSFNGALDDYESNTRDTRPKKGEPGSSPKAPWHDDACWPALWDAVVCKVRTDLGVFVLTALARGEIGNESLWTVGVVDLRAHGGGLRIFSWSAKGLLVEH